MKFKINGVEVTSKGIEDFTEQDAAKYVDYVLANTDYDEPLESVEVILCDDGKVDVEYYFHGQKFERIRRITGYLTGDVTSWNDAKRSEERERVKHGLKE